MPLQYSILYLLILISVVTEISFNIYSTKGFSDCLLTRACLKKRKQLSLLASMSTNYRCPQVFDLREEKLFVPQRGGHWGLRFGYFLDWFFGFCAKNVGFSVLLFIAFCGVSVYSILFSVFVRILTGILGFGIRQCALSVFHIGFRFLFDLSSSYTRGSGWGCLKNTKH